MSTNNNTFNEAISLQQSKKYDEALAIYTKLLDKSHDATELTNEQASVISQNIAVVYMQQNNVNLAYVYNKKALVLDPNNTAAQKFQEAYLKNYKVTEIARDISTTEQLNNLGLKFVPLEAAAVVTFVFFVITLKMLFNFLLEQKKAVVENRLPNTLNWKFYLSAAGLVLTTGVLSFKSAELKQHTGIIKANSTSVMTAAGEKQAIITEANLGQVVQILQTQLVEGTEYTQIKVTGAFSGWIKKADIEPLNSAN